LCEERWNGFSRIESLTSVPIVVTTDPLPAKHLHNTLAEFVPQFPPEFLPAGSQLGNIVPFEGGDADQPLGVDVDWVIAVSFWRSKMLVLRGGVAHVIAPSRIVHCCFSDEERCKR
jgi:hypothetical protein